MKQQTPLINWKIAIAILVVVIIAITGSYFIDRKGGPQIDTTPVAGATDTELKINDLSKRVSQLELMTYYLQGQDGETVEVSLGEIIDSYVRNVLKLDETTE